MKRASAAALLLLAAACGETSSGTGTGTLFADVAIEGKPQSTHVEATLRLRGEPVIGANVLVTDVETGQSITLDNGGKADRPYKGDFGGRYARTLKIQITAGEDRLEAQLEGPSPHVITRPPNNAIVRRGDFDVLEVEWDAAQPAQVVVVSPEGAKAIHLESDTGHSDVPLGSLRSGDQRIRVERENRVDLAGGTEGSVMRSRYEVDNRFTLEG